MTNPTLDKIRPYAKAVVGFVAPGAVLLGAAVTDASPSGSSITAAEWVTAIVACVVTSAGVFGVRNAPTKSEAGAGELKLIAMVALGVILAVVLVIPLLERTF